MTLRSTAILAASLLLMAGFSTAEELPETGRGLITTEGPTGLFISPTSGTLPKGAVTGQYCAYFPNNETNPVGHGLLGSYGVTSDLEIGVQALFVAFDGPDNNLNSGGPFVRYRLIDQATTGAPEISVGFYSLFGNDALQQYNIFAAAFYQVPFAPDAAIRSIGFHGGVRNKWLDTADITSFTAYGGAEIELPLRIYGVFEVTTKDEDVGQTDVPYAFGAQWRASGINISVAGIHNGSVSEPSFYFGVGFAH